MGWNFINGIPVGRSSGSHWKPQNLVAVVISDTAINLTWSGGKLAKVERSTDGVNYTEIGTGTDSYSSEGLTANTLYYFRVKGGKYSNVISALSWTAEYKAVNDAFSVKPVNSIATEYNALVKAYVDCGAWATRDFWNLKAVHTNDNLEAQLDWKNPARSFAFNIPASPLPFLAHQGFTGDLNRYIDFGIPLTGGNYAQNSASLQIYKRVIGTNAKVDAGTYDGTTYMMSFTHNTAAGQQFNRFNNKLTTADATAPSAYTGLFTHNRTASANYAIWRAKTKFITITQASTGIPTGKKMYEFGYNNNNDGAASTISDSQNSLINWGAGMTDAQIEATSDAIDTFFTNVNYIERFDGVLDNSITYAAGQRNSFGEYKFNYSGETLYITCNPTIYAGYPDDCYLDIYTNGALTHHVQFATTVEKMITLSKGTKVMRIVESMVVLDTTVKGCFITSIRGDNTYSKIDQVSVAEKLVFLGDSITNGAFATNPATQGYSTIFRETDNRNVAVFGYGGAKLYHFAETAGKITATVGHITTLFANVTNTKKLIIALGVNDEQGDSTAVVTFQAWYEALLDAINTADNTIQIYCLSPIFRFDEGALLASYRTAIDTICAARPTFCTHIAGGTILTYPADYTDGLHPDDGGHIKLYDAVDLVV